MGIATAAAPKMILIGSPYFSMGGAPSACGKSNQRRPLARQRERAKNFGLFGGAQGSFPHSLKSSKDGTFEVLAIL